MLRVDLRQAWHRMLRTLANPAAVLCFPESRRNPASKPRSRTRAIVAQLPGRGIAALIAHRPSATMFIHELVLFSRLPRRIKLRLASREIRFRLRANFPTRIGALAPNVAQ